MKPALGHRRGWTWLLLCLLVLLTVGPVQAVSLASPAPATAATEDNSFGNVPIMIVLDLSGSMNDDDGTGTIKLDGAKAALADVARDIAPGTEVGLWTYPGSGRNVADGCSLGDANFALGTLDPTQIDAEIDALSADGDTPTGPALEAAIDHMKDAGRNSGLVILVSDGLSNCGTPPCEVAQQARADGFDITTAVAGFQVSGEGRKQLECVAQATRGVYVDVKDSSALRDAVTEFVGVQLEVTTKGMDATLASGVRHRVSLTVKNTSPTITAKDLTATLAFVDAGKLDAVVKSGAAATTVFPAVRPPRVPLGNLPPGEPITYTWTISVPTVTALSVAAPRITLQSASALPVGMTGKWNISPDSLSLADAGPILRDATSVAILGDSYSAGEGTFDYLTGDATARESCHRSLLTYGLMLFDDDGNLTNDEGGAIVACSGAVTQDYSQWNSPGTRDAVAPQREQLDALLAADGEVPDVALMTFGGNDIGFAGVVVRCALSMDCTSFNDYKDLKQPFRLLPAAKYGEADAMVGPLTNLYVAVAARLNTDQAREKRGGAWAPLVVLPYPQVLAANASCSNFTAKEREFGIELGKRLNASVSKAVEEAAKRGLPVYYAADVTDAVLPDHTACAGEGQRWINPVSISAALQGNKVEQMHPNARGYAAMTTALVQWSQGVQPLPGPFQLPPDPLGPRADWLGQIGTSLNQLTVPDDAEEVDLSAPPSDIYHQAAPDQPLHVTADGYAPNSEVRVVMNSTPRTLGVRTADDQGRLDAVVAVPFDADRGEHTLTAEGFDPGGAPVVWSAPITVVTPIAWWVWGIIGVSVVALAAGGLLIWRGR